MRGASSPLRTALRIVSLALVALVVFAATAVPCAQAIAWWQGTPLTSPATLLIGTVCGLSVWLFMAAFHLKREAVLMPVDDDPTFRRRVREHLHDQGYDAVQLTRHALVFRPGFTSYLFGGGVSVTLERGLARIVGPKERIEALVRRLRLDSYVDKDHKALTESSTRLGKSRLKRVQISLRVPRDQWDGVRRWVVDRLGRHGDVVCEVSILAQSETGIPAAVVETEVRNWLHERKLQAVIHKEYQATDREPTSRASVTEVNLDETLLLPTTQLAEATV